MRPFSLGLTLSVALGGCDSSDLERVPQEVFVKAESVEFVGITSGFEGRAEAVFSYVGSVPAPCYELSGSGFTSRGGGRADVTVTARATAESCSGDRGTIRVERLELPALSSAPGTYTYVFDRREDAPIELEVTFP